jgi:hypothetical protein
MDCFMATVLAFQIVFIRSYSPHLPKDKHDLEWAYYKNSGFQDCSTRTPDHHVDCDYLFVPGRLSNGDHAQEYSLKAEASSKRPTIPSKATQIRALSYKDNTTASTYSWCDLQSCFANPADPSEGFQLLPTVPLPSAFGHPGLAAWQSLTITALGATWAVLSLVREKPHYAHECKGAGVVGHAFNIYDFATFVIWWTVLGMRGPDGTVTGGLSIVAWFTIRKHAALSRYHPMGCWLEGLNRTRWRLSRTVIRAALFSAALAIWLASGYMFLRNFGAAAKYECVEGLLPNAAESDGSARCGLRAICAEDAFGLLTDPGFDALNDVGGSTIYMVMFAMLNGVAGPPVMLIAYQ